MSDILKKAQLVASCETVNGYYAHEVLCEFLGYHIDERNRWQKMFEELADANLDTIKENKSLAEKVGLLENDVEVLTEEIHSAKKERDKAYKSGNYDLVRKLDVMAKQDGLTK